MSNRISIVEDPLLEPGSVIISVADLPKGQEPQIMITRKQTDRPHLGPNGWQAAEHLLSARQFRQGDKGTELVFGHEMTDHLDLDTDVILSVPEFGLKERHFWPANMVAPGTARLDLDISAQPDLEGEIDLLPSVESAESEPDGEIEEPLVEDNHKAPFYARAYFWLILIAATLLVGLLLYFYLPRTIFNPDPDVTPPADIDLSELYEQYRDEGGHETELLELGEAALAAGFDDLGFVAITLSADRGLVAAKLQLARWHDPFEAERRLVDPNANIAAQYYSGAAEAGNQDARLAIERLCDDPDIRAESLDTQPFDWQTYCQ